MVVRKGFEELLKNLKNNELIDDYNITLGYVYGETEDTCYLCFCGVCFHTFEELKTLFSLYDYDYLTEEDLALLEELKKYL